MFELTVSWAMALYLSDNLRHAKIDFQSFVTSRTQVLFVINEKDLARAQKICGGWERQ